MMRYTKRTSQEQMSKWNEVFLNQDNTRSSCEKETKARKLSIKKPLLQRTSSTASHKKTYKKNEQSTLDKTWKQHAHTEQKREREEEEEKDTIFEPMMRFTKRTSQKQTSKWNEVFEPRQCEVSHLPVTEKETKPHSIQGKKTRFTRTFSSARGGRGH